MNTSGGNSIDNKIVSLEFQNQDFEKNAKQSLSTLERLKKALQFPKTVTATALDGVASAANLAKTGVLGLTNAVGGLGNALDTIKSVSAFSIIAKEAQKAEESIKNAIKSVTIAPATAGWDKYAEKTSAVQTIMSATGRSIEEVTEQLEILNWFSDETSYSFTDMTSNVGKFTAAGVKLEDAVNAMQGIANWAALAGQGVGEAQRAMYNISQAMSAGSIGMTAFRANRHSNCFDWICGHRCESTSSSSIHVPSERQLQHSFRSLQTPAGCRARLGTSLPETD